MRLYRFRYSPFARKVQMLLDLIGARYDAVEVAYGERTELAELTGGYVYVPVLVDDDGAVVVESREICEHLLRRPDARHLVPPPLDGPIWAYADFADGPLEDVLFRIASPAVRDAWPSASDRALYVLVKERKFGAGCVDAWLRDRDELIARARKLLAPTVRTVAARPFLFGDAPTLADAALYGQCAMLGESEPGLLERIDPALVVYALRVEEAVRDRREPARGPTAGGGYCGEQVSSGGTKP
jgi:glutathione S-transferase